MPRQSTSSVPLADPEGVSEVYLQPGQYFVGAGKRVRTLLGSCVSITLWHPRLRIGAMSHFLLWARRERPAVLDARYGNEALALMRRDLARLGVQAHDCEGKLFGGGNMFPEHNTGERSVGQQNGQLARDMLQQQGIALVSESLFGAGHRQIVFDTDTGEVWARQVQLQGDT